jgi:hypothetical protein
MQGYVRFDIKLHEMFEAPTLSFGVCTQVSAVYSVGSTASAAGSDASAGISMFELHWLPFLDQFIASTAATWKAVKMCYCR